jgi:hypothetical protein
MNINVDNAFMVALMPQDEPAEWQSAVEFLRTLDSCSLAKCVFLVRTPDWKSLVEEVESRLSRRGTYFLCPLAPGPTAQSTKSFVPDTLLPWLYKR